MDGCIDGWKGQEYPFRGKISSLVDWKLYNYVKFKNKIKLKKMKTIKKQMFLKKLSIIHKYKFGIQVDKEKWINPV